MWWAQLPEATPAATTAHLETQPDSREAQPPPIIARAIALITQLLEGGKPDLNQIDCDFGDLPPFNTDVYAATRAIPPGETLTYGDIAQQLGDKRLAQQVGGVLGRNPLPIIVPCHRVVGADGKLTGFSAYGGTEAKRRMLTIEGAKLEAAAPGLFDDLPITQ